MDNGTNDLRQCPTRIDGAPVLFAHKVTCEQCLERQRALYHKCYSCAHSHGFVATRPELRDKIRARVKAG
jgi:hypothetical protein